MAETRFEIASRVLEQEEGRPYTYGEGDCFFMGCRMADAFDPSRGMEKKYAGSYTTLRGAHRAMVRRGFRSLTELLASDLEQIAPAAAQIGDLAVVLVGSEEHVAVCFGQQFVTREERGRGVYGLRDVVSAFRT